MSAAMTDSTRDLLIRLVSHMSYMQGQLEADHQFAELEDYYWYRESVALREKVQQHLATTTTETTMTDFRAELQALIDAAESFADPVIGHRIPWQTSLDRARDALAEPQGEGPTDEELLTRAADALGYLGGPPWDMEPTPMSADHLLTIARAVLARWGRPTGNNQ